MNAKKVFGFVIGFVLLSGSVPLSFSETEEFSATKSRIAISDSTHVQPFSESVSISASSRTSVVEPPTLGDEKIKIPKPMSEKDREKKFDDGFYEKITDLAKEKSYGTVCVSDSAHIDFSNAPDPKNCTPLSSLDEEKDFYNVIIMVPKVEEDKFDKKPTTKLNKDRLELVLSNVHGVEEYYKAKALSFVTAKVPITEIPRIADYGFVESVGDGTMNNLMTGHDKITQFMIQKNAPISSFSKANISDDDSPRVAFDEQLPVFVSYVNDTSKELVVGLDYNSATRTYDDYESKIFDVVGNEIPFKLITGFAMELACNSQIDDCSPLWGGIEMSDPSGDGGTITLPWANNDGEIGFIVSGHVVGGSATANVFQPAEFRSNSDFVGSVITNLPGPRSSDSAFVETESDKTLGLEIFKTSNQSYDVIGTKTSVQTPEFLVIHKVGIGTGETFASVLGKGVSVTGGTYGTLTNQVTSAIPVAGGDSGAPVFDKDTGNDVYFVGIVVGEACFSGFPPTTHLPIPKTEQECLNAGGDVFTYYSPWESIQSDLNLVDFDEICSPPTSGDWNITSDCTVISDATITDDVIVNSPAQLTIPNGVTLDIDFVNDRLLIKDGASVLIKQGGKIN